MTVSQAEVSDAMCVARNKPSAAIPCFPMPCPGELLYVVKADSCVFLISLCTVVFYIHPSQYIIHLYFKTSFPFISEYYIIDHFIFDIFVVSRW